MDLFPSSFIEKCVQQRKFYFSHLHQTGSTNSDLVRYVKDFSVDSPVILWVDEQTAGRGTRGRTWSNGQESLLFSVACHLNDDIHRYTGVSLIIGAKIVDYLKSVGVDATLKWPNDIVIGDSKLAGILVENVKGVDGRNVLIIGVGLNLKIDSSMKEHLHACAIDDVLTLCYCHDVKQQWVLALSSLIVDGIQEAHDKGLSLLKQRWESIAAWHNQPIDLYFEGKFECSAILHGIDERGRLLVLTSQGIRAFMSGTISLRKK